MSTIKWLGTAGAIVGVVTSFISLPEFYRKQKINAARESGLLDSVDTIMAEIDDKTQSIYTVWLTSPDEGKILDIDTSLRTYTDIGKIGGIKSIIQKLQTLEIRAKVPAGKTVVVAIHEKDQIGNIRDSFTFHLDPLSKAEQEDLRRSKPLTSIQPGK